MDEVVFCPHFVDFVFDNFFCRSKSGTLEKGQAHNHQDTPLPPNADGNTKAEKNGSSSKRNLSAAVSFKSPITSWFPARIGITSGSDTPTMEPEDTAKTAAPFSAYSKNSWRRSLLQISIRFLSGI